MLGEIGPFFKETNLEAWMQELVKIICNAGVVIGPMFKGVDEGLLRAKANYLDHLNEWNKTYFGAPDVWEQTK
jgi:hypothetical protein